MLHLNNSYHPYNSHIDRHENLNKGFIHIDKLKKFIKPFKHLPMILETSPPYEEQIETIESE